MEKKQPAGKKPAKQKKASNVPAAKKSKVKGFENLPADAVEEVTESPVLPVIEATVTPPAPAVISEPGAPEQPKTGREKFMENLQNDNIFVESSILELSDLTGMKCDRKYSRAIVSGGKIVSVVSPAYGFVRNEDYFIEVERQLVEADLKYVTRSINRENKHFAVDYILSDESYHVNIKGDNDKVIPMLRFTNSYAGGPVTGTLGIFREVCANGLHVAQTKIGFKFRHKSKAMAIALPKIKETVDNFRDNEFFSLHKKFEVMAEVAIPDLSEFVKFTCSKLDLFKYEASEKNPNTPSAKAKSVMETIAREAKQLGVSPNYWLGYNAFNEAIHADKKSFTKQRKTDARLFNAVLEMATN